MHLDTPDIWCFLGVPKQSQLQFYTMFVINDMHCLAPIKAANAAFLV